MCITRSACLASAPPALALGPTPLPAAALGAGLVVAVRPGRVRVGRGLLGRGCGLRWACVGSRRLNGLTHRHDKA